jgi:putative tricarboxylic transport membrane protein
MTRERAGSLIFLAVGVYGLFFSLQLPVGKWNEPGPGVFPLVLSSLLSLSGVLWFIKGKAKEGQEGKIDWGRTLKNLKTPLQIAGVTAAFIVALHPVGYLAASFLYLLVLFLWVSRYRPWTALGLAVLFGVGSWLFFERLLNVQLPPGFFPL